MIHHAPIPAALRGRVQPPLTIEQVRQRIAYDRALDPPRRRVSAEEFEDIVYDAVARDRSRSRTSIVASMRKLYEVAK